MDLPRSCVSLIKFRVWVGRLADALGIVQPLPHDATLLLAKCMMSAGMLCRGS